MFFEWDEKKEFKNIKKHGVSFEHAKTVWNDHFALEFFDEIYAIDEMRFHILGRTPLGKLLLIVFQENESADIIRIISARYATLKERKIYEKRIRLIKNEN